MASNMNPKVIILRRKSQWILFAAVIIFAPVPFFMIVVGGFIPLSAILYMLLEGLVVAIPKGSAEGFYMLGIFLLHVLIFGGLLYLLAWGIAKLLFRLFSPAVAKVIVGLLVTGLAVSSLFQIYRLPGHNSSAPANIIKVVSEFVS